MKTKWKPKRIRGHEWFPVCRGLSYRFCGRCGIINLSNKATQQVIERPCKGLEEEDTK